MGAPNPAAPAAAPTLAPALYAAAVGPLFIEFLRMLLTIWERCVSGIGGGRAAPPTASERCFACVRLRTSFTSVRFSCCSRESA